MFEAIKKLMEAAEELGTVSRFSACDWLKPGEFRVEIEGKSPEGIAFKIDATLTLPLVDVEHDTEEAAE